jgi:CrcB protein
MTGRSRSVHPLHPGLGVLVVGLGGACGAVVRWALENAFPVDADGFPWVTLLVNVGGSALLAALPLLSVARRRAWVGPALGTGVLGGFTTMSTASVETFVLLDGGHVGLATAYCVGTLAAALVAVLLVDRLTTLADRGTAEDEGWDE